MNNPTIKHELLHLINTEYLNALCKHGSFVDCNQAESVLRSELLETADEMRLAVDEFQKLFNAVRDHNPAEAIRISAEVEKHLVRVLEEGVQAAAMCRKFEGLSAEDNGKKPVYMTPSEIREWVYGE